MCPWLLEARDQVGHGSRGLLVCGFEAGHLVGHQAEGEALSSTSTMRGWETLPIIIG